MQVVFYCLDSLLVYETQLVSSQITPFRNLNVMKAPVGFGWVVAVCFLGSTEEGPRGGSFSSQCLCNQGHCLSWWVR